MKKENLYIVVLVAFLVGFISGAVFAVYKLKPAGGGQSSAAPADNSQNQAIINLEAQVTANPNDGTSWTRLGNLYYDSNQPQKAIGAYTRALELIPPNANVTTDLGVMYRRAGQPDKAVETFLQATTIDPTHEQSRLNMAIVLHYDLHEHERALAVLDELLKVNPAATAANGQPVSAFVTEIKKTIGQEAAQQQ